MTTEERLRKPKRRNRWMLAMVFIAFTPLYQQATARIGETPEQCQARYGEPVKADKDNEDRQFLKDDILITVKFYKGQADYIFFESKKMVSPAQLKGLSDSEVQGLLDANGGARSWIRSKPDHSPDYKPGKNILNYGPAKWWTKDGMLLATQLGCAEFLIVTKDHQQRFEEEEKAKKNKKLQGF